MVVGITLNRFFGILASIIIWLIFLFFSYLKSNKKKIEFKKEMLRFSLFIYIGFIVSLTLLPITIPSHGIVEDIYINFNIFSIFKYGLDKFVIINILGNLLLFTPLVILTSLNGYKIFDKVYKVIFYGIILSLFIESIQYIEVYLGLVRSQRVIDIIDIFLNASGAVIGFIVMKIFYYIR
ncbi:MAG: VanZ family protein [Clostridium sp.]|uniref:VanZ family protein n=1 Tax=Clostridium sp. TaxID=1506 RepID=UPI003EE74A9D